MFCPNSLDSLPELMSTNCPNWGRQLPPPWPPVPYAYACRVMLTHLGGHPSRARHAHRDSLFTESNTLVWSINAKQRSPPFSPVALLALSVCLVTEWWWWMFSGGSRRKWRPKSTDSIKDDLSGNEAQDARSFNVFFLILVRCFIKDQLKLIVLNLGPFQILSFRSQIS